MPSPVPLLDAFPSCSKGVKSFSKNSGDMPFPVSVTVKRILTRLSTRRGISLIVREIEPPGEVNLTALERMLSST